MDGLYVNMELCTACRQNKKHVDAEMSVFWEVFV